MQLNEFINRNLGKKVDFDGQYGAQCVDLFRQYCRDVLGTEHTGGVEGAKDLFLKYSELPLEKKHFIKIVEPVPEAGDVLVWGATKSNPYGHVAIFIAKSLQSGKLIVFEQDGFRQDGAKFAVRDETNLLGVLRFRGRVF